MVVFDPAFKDAGQKCGLEIWRVKDFKVEAVNSTEHGRFYGGDSYIVLSTSPNNQHNVHIWLGEETTADEAGTAAIKMVELDDCLGGGPVQYREMQGHESALFLSYFRRGITYLRGGYECGFKKVDPSKELAEPRLFHVKGKHIVRVQQVLVHRDSLNTGDAFILDRGNKLLVWLPPDCSRLERLKGVEQARNIRDLERSGRAEVEVIDTDWDKNKAFWEVLGGRGGPIKPPAAGGLDEDILKAHKNSLKLWKASDASGKLVVERIGGDLLDLSLLDTQDAFILDADSGGIFVWIGKGCSKNERQNAMRWAAEYLEKEGRPKWIQTVRVMEGHEPLIFLQWFSTDPILRPAAAKRSHRPEPKLYHCSDATGKVVIQEIGKFEQKDLEPDDVMILDSGCDIFLWYGEGANINEKKSGKAAAEKYLEISAIPRPSSAQIRIVDQGLESREFKALFPSWE